MNTSLQSLSLQELWELFPVVLSPHQPQWADWVQVETGAKSVFVKRVMEAAKREVLA